MAGNTFRMNETVVIDIEIEGIDTSISDVNIDIRSSVSNAYAVSGVTMEEIGNQKYRYFWDTRLGYSGTSGWSTYSAYNNPLPGGPIIYSGWSGSSGYSAGVSGLYNVTLTARDSNNHVGYEEFIIRIG
jgi:hypothetical protein